MILKKGDCVCFDASIPHVGRPIGDKPVKSFMVICPGENNRSSLEGLVLDYRKKKR
jgi:mannose-6-phosphate isomerase-like protein (cupin superfamily)